MLAGEDFQVRFRVGTDVSVAGPLGWVVDDIKIYRCVEDTGTQLGCSGTGVLVQNREFTADATCQASSSLEANTSGVVKSGATVVFQSAGTTLGAGFSVETGAVFTVENNP